MDGGALHHALEAGGGFGVTRTLGDQAGQVLVEKLCEVALELVHIHATGAQHRGGVHILAQGEEQVFQRRVFVAAVIRQGKRAVERLFQIP